MKGKLINKIKVLYTYIFVCFFVPSFGQNTLTKKEIKRKIIELNDYRLNKDYEFLVNSLDINPDYQNFEIKNKKQKVAFDSTINCYLSKKQLFGVSDSIVNHYYSLLKSKKYCDLISSKKYSFNRENAKNITLLRWSKIHEISQADISRRCDELIKEKAFIDTLLFNYVNGNFEKCIPLSDKMLSSSTLTSSLFQDYSEIVKDLLDYEIEYSKLKSNIIINPSKYILEDTFNLSKQESILRTETIEDILKNGKQEILNLKGNNPKLLNDFIIIESKLQKTLLDLRKYRISAPNDKQYIYIPNEYDFQPDQPLGR